MVSFTLEEIAGIRLRKESYANGQTIYSWGNKKFNIVFTTETEPDGTQEVISALDREGRGYDAIELSAIPEIDNLPIKEFIKYLIKPKKEITDELDYLSRSMSDSGLYGTRYPQTEVEHIIT